jgi:hypothetical protein
MMTLEDLDADVAVRRVMVAYMQACDQHDPNAVAVLFTEDAIWESLAVDADDPLIGREAIRDTYARDTSRLTFCVHYLTNERITITGDRARAGWSYFEPAVNRGTLPVWTAGRYQIDLRQIEGIWYFSHFRISPQLAAPYATGWVPDPMVALP